jgi:hypothetical protein
VTIKTRRRVFLSALMLLLTMPAEVVFFKALQWPDDKLAAQDWASSLATSDLSIAADSIQAYSLVYRRAIMRSLSPNGRAAVWRRHIDRYIWQHPELGSDALTALKAAQGALTPRALSRPTTGDRVAMEAVATQIEQLLGREEALYLLYQLGPRDTSTLASAEPLVMKLAAMVRRQVGLIARYGDCECAGSFGCGGYMEICTGEYYCQWDVEWPMCGWGWLDICDGMCRSW